MHLFDPHANFLVWESRACGHFVLAVGPPATANFLGPKLGGSSYTMEGMLSEAVHAISYTSEAAAVRHREVEQAFLPHSK